MSKKVIENTLCGIIICSYVPYCYWKDDLYNGLVFVGLIAGVLLIPKLIGKYLLTER